MHVGSIQFVYHLEQGNLPERSHSCTYVSLHNAGFIREDLPNKSLVSHADFSQGRAAYMVEASGAPGGKSQSLVAPTAGEVGFGLKPGD